MPCVEKAQVVSVRTNEVAPPEQLRREKDAFMRRADERIKESKQLEKERQRWYSIRFYSIVIGFLALLAASIWKGYC
jgi:hypothetical protein